MKDITEETANWLVKVMDKCAGKKWTEQEEYDYRLWEINNCLNDLYERAHSLQDKIESVRNRWYTRSSTKEYGRLLILIDKLIVEKKKLEEHK